MSNLTDIQRIRAFAAEKRWRKSRLAKEAGLGDTTLRGFDRPSWNPTARVVEKLSSVVPEGWEPAPKQQGAE